MVIVASKDTKVIFCVYFSSTLNLFLNDAMRYTIFRCNHLNVDLFQANEITND